MRLSAGCGEYRTGFRPAARRRNQLIADCTHPGDARDDSFGAHAQFLRPDFPVQEYEAVLRRDPDVGGCRAKTRVQRAQDIAFEFRIAAPGMRFARFPRIGATDIVTGNKRAGEHQRAQDKCKRSAQDGTPEEARPSPTARTECWFLRISRCDPLCRVRRKLC